MKPTNRLAGSRTYFATSGPLKLNISARPNVATVSDSPPIAAVLVAIGADNCPKLHTSLGVLNHRLVKPPSGIGVRIRRANDSDTAHQLPTVSEMLGDQRLEHSYVVLRLDKFVFHKQPPTWGTPLGFGCDAWQTGAVTSSRLAEGRCRFGWLFGLVVITKEGASGVTPRDR